MKKHWLQRDIGPWRVYESEQLPGRCFYRVGRTYHPLFRKRMRTEWVWSSYTGAIEYQSRADAERCIEYMAWVPRPWGEMP